MTSVRAVLQHQAELARKSDLLTMTRMKSERIEQLLQSKSISPETIEQMEIVATTTSEATWRH